MAEETQQQFLQKAKKRLASRHGGLTWDQLATLAGIEPRALKTYRMPESSADYRVMPKVVWVAFERLLAERQESGSVEDTISPAPPAREQHLESILPSALAALVVRQARLALVESRPILGTDRYVGDAVGLDREDRAAMALVSRACLQRGQRDLGAEIHELLYHCTQSLGDWLPLPSIHADRLSNVRLLDPEEGVPTREAEELAQRFVSATASIEELLFTRFREQLAKSSRLAATSYYTRVREFIVRHPIVTNDQLAQLTADLPSAIGVLIAQQFYEPVPEAWGAHSELAICAHCANAMTVAEGGLACRTRACAETLPAVHERSYSTEDSLRLTRGLRQYWQEPGFDEVRLFDEITAAGWQATLYPQLDRVDIEVGEVGIDLKAYVSPELLASKLERDIGGLKHYRRKWLVVPDRLIQRVPAYLERLRGALRSAPLQVLASSAVAQELARA